jgi:cellulose biosynthesis protein BcsQ
MQRRSQKILITSQKGGVGKSTLSANLVAYFRQVLGRRTALVDLDRQATASKWFRGAEEACIADALYQLDRGASQGITALNASRVVRKAAEVNDFVVTDLTWNDVLPKEFFYEFDLLIVPCSLSNVEVDSTMDFLERFAHVLNSSTRTPPKLVIAPSRIRQLDDYERMLSRIFNIEFFLAPPVNYSSIAQEYFGNTFIFNSPDTEIRQNFSDFAKAVQGLLSQMAAQPTRTKQLSPSTGHRDAGTVLDRFMLNRLANRSPDLRQRVDEVANVNDNQFLPRFLRSVSNRIRT